MEHERYRVSTTSRLGYVISYLSVDDDADADAADDDAAGAAHAHADAADAADDDAAHAAHAADDDAAHAAAAAAHAAHAADDAASSDDADDAASSSDDADDAASSAAAASPRIANLLSREPDMQNGLKIIQLPGRYAGWAVTRVGWLRRVSGDEWELIGARTIVRTGTPRALDSLASHGPMTDHTLSDSSLAPEEIHRLVIRRSLSADVEAWAEYCPCPSDWSK
jgi:hypothetical protein